MTNRPYIHTLLRHAHLRIVYTVLVSALPALILVGCYAFTGDGEPPEWTPDPKDVAQQSAQPGAGGSGGPGAAIFNQKCAVCHQMTGKGIPAVYPSLAGSELATGDPTLPIQIVLHGFQGPISRGGQSYNGVMQPWQNELSDQQIADVLTYVRSSWGNSAPAVDAAAVKTVRDATKGKVGAYTEPELLKTK
ncbi:MAG: cytochrome c [Ignavibacteriae bacterium]|nr:cytochrome c [Ignavibacteriota bacterium]